MGRRQMVSLPGLHNGGVAVGQKEILVEDEAPIEGTMPSQHTHTNKRQSLKAIKYFTIYICYISIWHVCGQSERALVREGYKRESRESRKSGKVNGLETNKRM